MQALDFLRNPAAGRPRPLVAVHGDDAYLRFEVVQTLIRQMIGDGDDENPATHYAGDSCSLAEILDELRTIPFLAKFRVVIVDEADRFVSTHRRELEAYAEHPSTTGILILCPRLWPANTRLAKQIAAKGLSIDCKVPKAAELPEWLIGLARTQHEVRLEPDAARVLVDLVGPEVGVLYNELQKLSTYVAERGSIGQKDVLALVGAGKVETIWRVLDAATSGQTGRALHDLDRLLTSGEHPVGLLAAMSASLRKVYHAGQLRRERLPLNEACREAGIPAFAQDATERQHRHLGPRRVDRLPAMLLEADLALKGGSQLAPRVVIERFLIDLARPRRD